MSVSQVLNLSFPLTADQQLNLFMQWLQKNPNTDLDHMTMPRFKACLREVLLDEGWKAIDKRLPDEIEIKKVDYKSALRGILRF